jgi:hypothetical protein
MRLFVVCLLTLYIGSDLPAFAQATEPTREQLETQISIMRDRITYLESELAGNNGPSADPELQKAYTQTRIKQYEYLRALMDANISTLRAQRFAGGVILWLVVLVALAGIAFAGYQLWKSVAAAGVQPSNELEISASRVRLTSSVVGVIVLSISIIFLSIYTSQIYQLRVIDKSTAESAR